MVPAEVAVRSGLPARKCRNWRRAIVLRLEGPTAPVASFNVLRESSVIVAVRSVSSSLQRLQVGDDVLAILGIGNADDHLGPVHISRGIAEIFVEFLLVPGDASG